MIGKIINGYKILSYINQGGMAEVWYAENVLGKPAAIKILKKKYSDEVEIVARFENEAKLTVSLNHSNVRNVYDYVIFEERPCIIMEYLEGSDLSRRLTDGKKFTNESLMEWWNDLVNALNYTHAKGIIHRDIKPSNIFITINNELKLLDFGIARVKESISLTQTGQGLGTIIYMSPEQVKDPKRVTYKTDIYSVAVTFFHLVTGEQPYDRTSSSDFEIQTKIIQEPLNTKLLPPIWRGFLQDYLQKNPEKRSNLSFITPDEQETVLKIAIKDEKEVIIKAKRGSFWIFIIGVVIIVLLALAVGLLGGSMQHLLSGKKGKDSSGVSAKGNPAQPNENKPAKASTPVAAPKDTIDDKMQDDGNPNGDGKGAPSDTSTKKSKHGSSPEVLKGKKNN